MAVNVAPGRNARWDTDKVQVTARSVDSLVAVKDVPLARLKCRVGNTVLASIQGLTMTLDDRACIR